MFERVKGAAQKVVGQVQEGYGEAVGDDASRIEGQARQLAGHTRMIGDEALDQLRDVARTNPIATLAVVGGLAFFFGAVVSGTFSTRRGR